MDEIRFKPTFVKTKNVRNFEVMMDGLAINTDEGCLAMVWGESGRGKTRTAQWWHSHKQGSVFMRALSIWRGGAETGFLLELAKELRIVAPPKRKQPLFKAVLAALVQNAIENGPVSVFIDEMDRLPDIFFECTRDLSDLSGVPFVLLGEEELVPRMQRLRRIWRRTYRQLEFVPVAVSDVIVYAQETTGLKFSPPVADIFHKARCRDISDGNLGLIKRAMLALTQYCNAKQTVDVTEEMATIAVKAGLSGA